VPRNGQNLLLTARHRRNLNSLDRRKKQDLIEETAAFLWESIMAAGDTALMYVRLFYITSGVISTNS